MSLEFDTLQVDILQAYKNVIALGCSLEDYSWDGLDIIKARLNKTLFLPKVDQKIDYYHTQTSNWGHGSWSWATWQIATIKQIRFIKPCKKEIINEKSQAAYQKTYDLIMNVIDDVYKEVVHCIASFAAGVTINCSNDTCDNEITFIDDMDFENYMDIDGKKISKYTMWDVVKNRESLHETIQLFGKRCRIFCNECIESVRKCRAEYCSNQDVEIYCADHPEMKQGSSRAD